MWVSLQHEATSPSMERSYVGVHHRRMDYVCEGIPWKLTIEKFASD